MSKKSKRKVDVRSSILILLLIAILLIASTYAWFTANQTVTVSSLDVHVEAQNGLQISTDATTWKSIIDKADITTKAYAGNTNVVPENMEPVSTIGEIDESTGFMKMYYGTVEPNEEQGGRYELTAKQVTEKVIASGEEDTNKFIAFDMFLKVDATTNLKMTTGSNVVAKQDTPDSGLKNAARVAFCVEGNQSAGSEISAITSLKGATSLGSAVPTTYFWEPNSDVHTPAAIANARDAYGITTSASGAAQIEYYGIKKAIETGIPLINTSNAKDSIDADNFTLVTPNYVTGETMTDTNIFTLQPGITKVRVYMWVEGQDVDCENTASGSDISYNLQLQVVE